MKLTVLKVCSGFTGNCFKSLKSAEYRRNSCYRKSTPWCEWHKTWGGLETEKLLDCEIGKPETGPINSLFRKKQAIKRKILRRLRHMFFNKFKSDIKCCICFWWKRGRKGMTSKNLSWNWSLILSVAFSCSAEVQKPLVTVCEMHRARDSPFLHSTSATRTELSVNNAQKQLGWKLPVFIMYFYAPER